MYQYEYHSNVLSVPASLLYDELKIMSYNTYKSWVYRGKLIKTRLGKGKGNAAMISFYDLEDWIKKAVIDFLGDPKKVVKVNELESYIETDFAVVTFFANHRKPDGSLLSQEKQIELTHTAWVLNGIKALLKDKETIIEIVGLTKTWKELAKAVENLRRMTDDFGEQKWKIKKVANPRSLRRKYERFIEHKNESLIHAGEGSKNRSIINEEIGDFLLSTYCLPNKLSIPEVKERYDFERARKENWKSLTNSAIYSFLEKAENKRIWILARHGKEAYKKAYKRTHTIDKSNWFPNCYWAIDGTKLDWIHVWEDSANKLGAKLKINVLFDVYSEKIIGWDLSFSESHIQHFNAIKKGVNESMCRPYFITYDNQSGHKSERMQNLYSSLVALPDGDLKGGTHYAGAAYEHGNPAEGLFNRLQQQVISNFWFSDGQSVTVRRDDNKMNFDFIKEHKSSIKTVEELEKAWIAAVNMWNKSKHPKFKKSRNEVYQHTMPVRQELSLFDVMDKMWIEQKKRPVTYKKDGLLFRLADQKLWFEVYDKDGNIDLEFRRKYIGQKFIVRYDPSFLDGYIQLCLKDEKGDIINIANAQPKRTSQPVPFLMKEGDKEQWLKDHEINKIELKRDLKAYKDLMQRSGITPEKMIEEQELVIKMKGDVDKARRSQVESEENLTVATSRM